MHSQGDSLRSRRPPLSFSRNGQLALQHEEHLLDLVGVGGVALAGHHIHDREREVSGRNHGRIAVLAGTAGADETVLGALVAFDLGVLERRPIALLVAKTADVFAQDFLDRNAFELLRARVPCGHDQLLSFDC